MVLNVLHGVADFLEPFIGDIVSAILGGMVTASVAIFVYVLQKHHEHGINTYNTADILYNEMRRLADPILYDNSPLMLTQAENSPTSTKIYEGLLSSGNIKYITADNLRNELDRFYHYVHNGITHNPDYGMHENIFLQLESIKRNNSPYKARLGDLYTNTLTIIKKRFKKRIR